MKNNSNQDQVPDLFKFQLVDSKLRPNYSFKVVFCGEAGVGKSSIVSRRTKSNFNASYEPTVCFEHSWQNFKIGDIIMRIQIWDTCGQELYRSLIKNFYRSSMMAFVVFSLNDLSSFEKLNQWIKEVKEIASTDMIIYLIGNKKDTERKVPINLIEEFKTTYNIKYYIETSAKSGENIDLLFDNVLKILYETFVIPILNDKSTDREVSFYRDKNYVDLENPKNKGNCRECLCC
ncbi:MAG: GTP-binding protein [archaeon]|nr:GTP-binding protein [archaeon]